MSNKGVRRWVTRTNRIASKEEEEEKKTKDRKEPF